MTQLLHLSTIKKIDTNTNCFSRFKIVTEKMIICGVLPRVFLALNEIIFLTFLKFGDRITAVITSTFPTRLPIMIKM